MAQQAPYGFKVTQKIFALRATYQIVDEATGQQVFTAKRQIFTLTPTLWIEDMNGNEVIRIKSNFFFKNRWKITQGGNMIGEVEFPIIRICGIKFDVHLAGQHYTASDILGWSFNALDASGNIGFTLDKKVFRIKDTYKVTVYPPLEPLFGLAAALTIDSKFYQGNK